jgi:hypothetical protein
MFSILKPFSAVTLNQTKNGLACSMNTGEMNKKKNENEQRFAYRPLIASF